VDRELQDRENRRVHRYLGAARLRTSACVEDIDFHHPRGLDRSQILHLVACHWVDAHQPVLIVGPTGAGKTYIAAAFGAAPCRLGEGPDGRPLRPWFGSCAPVRPCRRSPGAGGGGWRAVSRDDSSRVSPGSVFSDEPAERADASEAARQIV
jgi:hypothetical protein